MPQFCILDLEPVGAKAPTFATSSKSFTFVQSCGDNFALLCQAQAFPVPLIRYTCIAKQYQSQQSRQTQSNMISFCNIVLQNRSVQRHPLSPVCTTASRLRSERWRVLRCSARLRHFLFRSSGNNRQTSHIHLHSGKIG